MNTIAQHRRAAFGLPNANHDALMGGYHFVTTLDFLQHKPVKQASLFSFAGWTPEQVQRNGNALARHGHSLWQSVDTAIVLQKQHRFSTATPGGKALWDLVQLMWNTDPRWKTDPSWAHDTAKTMVELIDSRVVSPGPEMDAFMKRSPKAIVLRNEFKPSLGLMLAMNHAQQLQQRLILWRCLDTGEKGRPLSSAVHNMLAKQQAEKTGDIPTYMAFFPGISYVFEDSKYPDLCWVNNLRCEGVKLLLDPDEPPDDLTKPYRMLTKPPICICVRPDGTTIGKVFPTSDIPMNCLPVPKSTKSLKVSDHTVSQSNTVVHWPTMLPYNMHPSLHYLLQISP